MASGRDLLIEAVGFQALEDHRVLHRVRPLSGPLAGDDAGGAQAGEQVLHQAQDLTWSAEQGPMGDSRSRKTGKG